MTKKCNGIKTTQVICWQVCQASHNGDWAADLSWLKDTYGAIQL